jgi:hypothetical protein
MVKTLLFSAALFTAACSKKENKSEAPPAGEKPAAGEPAKPAGGAAAPAAGAMTCDTAIPESIRTKYLPGHKVELITNPAKHAATCKVITPDGTTNEFMVACADFMKNGKQLTIDGLKKQFPDMKDIEGAGDGAVGHTIPTGEFQFTGYSSGAFCQVNGMVPKGVDAPAMIKDLLAAMPTK